MRSFPLALLLNVCALAQAPLRESVVVTGTWQPLELEEIDRSVASLAAREHAIVLNTLADLLQLDSSLDLRRRAPDGIQGDLSIRGAGFGQTLVMVDGQRLNDAQSGHHNLDIPLPLESVERIEVLRGAGSTLYGSDAVGGAVNIVTRPPETAELRLRAAAGSFGVNQQRGTLSARLGRLAQQLTFSRDFSSGFRPNRDYRNLALASTSSLRSGLGTTGLTLGWMDRPFGADQFYGAYNSWERTRTWFGGLRQQLGERTQASFAWRRHTDLFVLYRDRPAVFTNRHASQSWQAALRRSDRAGAATLHYGAEGLGESIASNNLGEHSRGRGAAYAAVDFRALRRFSLSLGARQEMHRQWAGQFSPTAAGGVWLSRRVKLRASASRAFRIPTYTDLYYHDPANQGSRDLRPERAWSYEGGADLHLSPRASLGAAVFHRRESDGIDYTRRSSAEIWRAVNLHRLRFTGVEAWVRLEPARGQRVDLRFSALSGAQQALGELQSKYVFNYPRQSAVAAWTGSVRGLTARTRVGATARLGRDPYAVWDVALGRGRGRVRPFVQAGNLTAARYQEIAGVDMPGRSVLCGVELVVWGKR